MFFSINLDLFIFNLIPAFPMDGGRILHALLWPRVGFLRATEIAVAVAKFSAVVMVVIGISILFAGVKGWLLLVLIGVFVWIGATQQQQLVQGGMYGGDQWGDPYSFDSPGERSGIASWWQKRKEAKEQRRREEEARQDFDRKQRVDELLDKVNREGITSLTDSERRFLQDASKHFKDD